MSLIEGLLWKETMNNFELPKSPFTPQQTEEMITLRDKVIPWMSEQIKDAREAGIDTQQLELQFNNAKAQLEKLVKVYGQKYG